MDAPLRHKLPSRIGKLLKRLEELPKLRCPAELQGRRRGMEGVLDSVHHSQEWLQHPATELQRRVKIPR